MAIKQVLWSLDDNREINRTVLETEGRLETLLEKHIELLNPDWLIIGRQVGTIGGYIDLLAVDRAENLIVIELKKNKTPRDVTAQTLDYASCVSKYAIEDVADIYNKYTDGKDDIGKAFEKKFGQKIDEENFCTDISLVIVASQMDDSTERIINYLNTFNIPINVLFFEVFEFEGKKILSRTWMIDYKDIENKEKLISKNEWNGEYYVSFGEDDSRSWDDAKKYGFISGGGGIWYSQKLDMLNIGDRIWVNIPQVGYVGVGRVIAVSDFAENVKLENDKNIFELSQKAGYIKEHKIDEYAEHIVKVEWIKTFERNKAFKEVGMFGNQNIVCRPRTDKWDYTVRRLKQVWKVD